MTRVCTMILLAAMFSFARAAAQDRSAGAGFAWNEFTASFQIRMNDDGFLRTSLNLDMTDVISGKSLYPGFSADAAYLFEFAEKRFRNREYFTFFAGPGICAGYVRNVSGDFGIMGALSGCIGFDYVFNVPFSLGLTLEPAIGVHLRRTAFGLTKMDFYKTGLISSLMPHLFIKYRF